MTVDYIRKVHDLLQKAVVDEPPNCVDMRVCNPGDEKCYTETRWHVTDDVYQWAPCQLAFFREHVLKIPRDMLLHSVTSQQMSERSGQGGGRKSDMIFFTGDGDFVFKVVSEKERGNLLAILDDYTAYMRENAKSFLARYVGIYEVMGRTFVCMVSMLDATLPAPDRFYDLKGSVKNRKASPGKRTKKDIDFDERDGQDAVYFPTEAARREAIDQMERDTAFLRDHNIMDYSLFLAVGEACSKRMEGCDASRVRGQRRRAFEETNQRSKVHQLGIVDTLQTFTKVQKLQHVRDKVFGGTKEIKTRDGEVTRLSDGSIVPPEEYQLRFMDMIRSKIFLLRDQPSARDATLWGFGKRGGDDNDAQKGAPLDDAERTYGYGRFIHAVGEDGDVWEAVKRGGWFTKTYYAWEKLAKQPKRCAHQVPASKSYVRKGVMKGGYVADDSKVYKRFKYFINADDNQGEIPFRVDVFPDRIDIFSCDLSSLAHVRKLAQKHWDTIDWDRDLWNLDEYHNKKVHTITDYKGYWFGEDPNEGAVGNALLIKVSDEDYILIDATGARAFSTPGDVIHEFLAPISGYSPMPYPIGFGKSYVYRLVSYEKVARMPVDKFVMCPSDTAGDVNYEITVGPVNRHAEDLNERYLVIAPQCGYWVESDDYFHDGPHGPCEKSSKEKYVTRDRPPYPANHPGCKGQTKLGNDGHEYVSKSNSKGVYRWRKL